MALIIIEMDSVFMTVGSLFIRVILWNVIDGLILELCAGENVEITFGY